MTFSHANALASKDTGPPPSRGRRRGARVTTIPMRSPITMLILRLAHWVAALWLAFASALAYGALSADDLKPLADDSASEKLAGIDRLVASGDPRAAIILKAMREDALSALPDGSLVIAQGDGYVDALTGAKVVARRRVARGGHDQQPDSRASRRRARGVRSALAPTSACERESVAALEKALRSCARAARRGGVREGNRAGPEGAACARARRAPACERRPGEQARGDRAALGQRQRSDAPAAAAVPREERRTARFKRARRGTARRRGACDPLDRRQPAQGRARRRRVHRDQPRQRAAARGTRPCDHLRADGRHQHGARRVPDDRRVHDVRRAERVSAAMRRARSTGISPPRFPRRLRARSSSASSSSAPSCASSTAGRSRRCSRPTA